MTKIDLPRILREFGADMRLRDSENMGPTRCEVALATEVARLREAARKVREVLHECKRAIVVGDPYGNMERKIDALLAAMEEGK